jgi:hypothetical protein
MFIRGAADFQLFEHHRREHVSGPRLNIAKRDFGESVEFWFKDRPREG